jgi:hypothetical protein
MLIKQRAVIHFFTFKDFHASAIVAGLMPIHETEALALSTVKKWRKCFAEGKLRHTMTQGVEDRLLTT